MLEDELLNTAGFGRKMGHSILRDPGSHYGSSIPGTGTEAQGLG